VLSSVRSVGIYVGDQDRAKKFFTETLGFELLQDTPMGEGPGAARWIEVAPPDRNVILVLFTPDGQQDRIGTFSNVLFDCDDILATHKELAGRGGSSPRSRRSSSGAGGPRSRTPTATPTGSASAASSAARQPPLAVRASLLASTARRSA
jgi:catechol 2,3-dioxygenase-like lactoylglutathione lyase family enzyme